MFNKRTVLAYAAVLMALAPQAVFASDFSFQIPAPQDLLSSIKNFLLPNVLTNVSTKEAVPYAVVEYPAVYAQGSAGAQGSMTLYFQTVNNAVVGSPSLTACPAGWTNALSGNGMGYGPHYLGMFAHMDIANGNRTGFTRSTPSGVPVTIPPPTTTPTGGGLTGPGPLGGPGGGGGSGGSGGAGGPSGGGGGGGSGGGGVTTPNEPVQGGGETPDGPSGPTTPGGGDDPPAPTTGSSGAVSPAVNSNIASSLFFETAHAQVSQGYYLSSVAIGGDSVCSQSQKSIVNFSDIYNNAITSDYAGLYSDACFVDTSFTPNVTTCNRCRVCYK